MFDLKRIATRTSKAIAITAVTAGLAIGAAAPASAAPKPSGATLTIHKVNNSSYKVYIQGTFAMSQADAQGYINNLGTGKRAKSGAGLGGIYYHLNGDDPSYDTSVFTTPFYAGGSNPGAQPGRYLYATPQGLAYAAEFFVPAGALNEDAAKFGNQEDEIYADAQFVDGDNGTRTSYSNLIVRYF